MSDAPMRAVDRVRPRTARAGLLGLALLLVAAPAAAEPVVRLLELPFKVREMRGPRSEVATAVATSGLLPILRAGKDPVPVVLVWGEEGGAVLILENGSVAVKPVGREAVEDLVASETPRGALPGLRRALDGPLSVFLSGRTRSADGAPAATTLTFRERQPMAVSTDPKPVPIATATLTAGEGALFAANPPRIVTIAGRPAVLAATLTGSDAGGLVLATRTSSDPASWTLSASAPSGPRSAIAVVGDFTGTGTGAATVDSTGRLTLWTLAPDRIEPGPQAAGYTIGEGEADLAETLPREGGADLALPVAGIPALAIVSTRDGLRERARVTLPAPAGTGVATLGERLIVGLSDGRVAAIALDGGKP